MAKAFHPKNTRMCEDEERKMVIVPFYGSVSSTIGRLLIKAGIKTTYRLPGKLRTWQCQMNDPRDHVPQGSTRPHVHVDLCRLDKLATLSWNEHYSHLDQMENSGLAEYHVTLGHRFAFESTV